MKNSALSTRWLRICQDGGEIAIPGHSTIATYVLLWLVSKTPLYQSVLSLRLLHGGIAVALPVSTGTDSLHLPVLVAVVELQHLSPGPVTQLNWLVFQVPPVSTRRNPLNPRYSERLQVLGDVIPQYWTVPPHHPLEVSLGLPSVAHLQLIVAVRYGRQITEDIPGSHSPQRSRAVSEGVTRLRHPRQILSRSSRQDDEPLSVLSSSELTSLEKSIGDLVANI